MVTRSRRPFPSRTAISPRSNEVFELRPVWRNPGEVPKNRIAKATYVKRGQLWRVYWQRADLRWHRYDAEPEVFSIEEFVERDEHSCFFG